MANRLSTKVWQDPWYFIAFGFGSGLIPFAPGTWGSLAAIPLFLLMAPFPLPVYLLIVVVFFLLGVHAANRVSQELGIHDYSGIVCDEIVGLLLTLIAVPPVWYWILSGFLLFRLFDIWKPFPISWFDEKIKGGMGIMIDDVLAALPAWILVQVMMRSF